MTIPDRVSVVHHNGYCTFKITTVNVLENDICSAHPDVVSVAHQCVELSLRECLPRNMLSDCTFCLTNSSIEGSLDLRGRYRSSQFFGGAWPSVRKDAYAISAVTAVFMLTVVAAVFKNFSMLSFWRHA